MEPTEVELLHTARIDDEFELCFTTYSLGKRRLGSARIFRNNHKYCGPTKSGIDMPRYQVDALIPVLRRLSDELERGLCAPPCEYASLDAGRTANWLVQVLVHDTRPDGQFLDVRKFVTSDNYTGPTRKGIRLTVDHIDQLADGLEHVSVSLHSWREGLSGLFAPAKPEYEQSEPPADPGRGVPDHLKGYF
ncbi:PC4/YdbC family ssDNA-binding protein [Anaerosoma tenue]|uniref:PC4/YdbC family ssDNA-binding protein n=1 Tax=Anaerosoma tenue TaxID=2933588 RepID=UPI0022608D9B|nr:PC4/YdbC family ssDNA-binding protein [Anaerosoma tenue]MCK8114789.1 transcriptional coactivator p15/PC4 family protein [Anaerosoma tenue]